MILIHDKSGIYRWVPMRTTLVVLRIVVRFLTVARVFSFSIRLEGHWESPGLQFQRVPGFFQGSKTARAWCWSLPSTSEVNNEWLYNPIPTYTSTECTGTLLLYESQGFRSGTAENSLLHESDAMSTHYLLTQRHIPEERNTQLYCAF